MQLLLTCNSGLESIIKKEIKSLGYEISLVSDKLVYFIGDEKAIARINLRSRVGNKLYILIVKSEVNKFTDLFDLINQIRREEYISANQPFIVLAHTIKSDLTSIPTIQAISKKSIAKKLLGGQEGRWHESNQIPPVEILITLNQNIAHILINTTGKALHQRGYRTHSTESPIKENLAAGIIALANRRYNSAFYDFFCGSGTFVIEAALIARNIAPGLFRKFDFENFAWYHQNYLDEARQEAQDKLITNKSHTLIGSDINPQAIESAILNARNAGVDKYIKFEIKNFLTLNGANYNGITFISNPPYGIRMQDKNLPEIYQKIKDFYEKGKGISGGIITAFENFNFLIEKDNWILRKLYNGGEKSYFYKYLNTLK